jgi:hypothetical protein
MMSARWQQFVALARGISDDRIASGGAVILGTLFALTPLLTGRSDLATTMLVFLFGGLLILPGWRFAGQELRSWPELVAFVAFLVGMVVVDWLFGRAAILPTTAGSRARWASCAWRRSGATRAEA